MGGTSYFLFWGQASKARKVRIEGAERPDPCSVKLRSGSNTRQCSLASIEWGGPVGCIPFRRSLGKFLAHGLAKSMTGGNASDAVSPSPIDIFGQSRTLVHQWLGPAMARKGNQCPNSRREGYVIFLVSASDHPTEVERNFLRMGDSNELALCHDHCILTGCR